MKDFIEVSVKNRKTLIALNAITAVTDGSVYKCTITTRNGVAVKDEQIPLTVLPVDDSYNEVVKRIKEAQ